MSSRALCRAAGTPHRHHVWWELALLAFGPCWGITGRFGGFLWPPNGSTSNAASSPVWLSCRARVSAGRNRGMELGGSGRWEHFPLAHQGLSTHTWDVPQQLLCVNPTTLLTVKFNTHTLIQHHEAAAEFWSREHYWSWLFGVGAPNAHWAQTVPVSRV